LCLQRERSSPFTIGLNNECYPYLPWFAGPQLHQASANEALQRDRIERSTVAGWFYRDTQQLEENGVSDCRSNRKQQRDIYRNYTVYMIIEIQNCRNDAARAQQRINELMRHLQSMSSVPSPEQVNKALLHSREAIKSLSLVNIELELSNRNTTTES
jgi:hypothetical protein